MFVTILIGLLLITPQSSSVDDGPVVLVMDRQGKPIPAATLICDGTPVGSSDAEGSWRPAVGCERLDVQASGFLSWSGAVAPTVTLVRPSRLRIRVIDAETQTPVADASVVVRLTSAADQHELAEATTDGGGLAVIGDLPSGRATVSVSADNYRPLEESVAVLPESTERRTLGLARTVPLRGILRNGEAPVAGVEVVGRWSSLRAHEPDRPEPWPKELEMVSDEHGRFTTTSFPLRSHHSLVVGAFTDGGDWALANLDTTWTASPPPEAHEVTLDFQARRRVHGVVINEEKQPVEDVLVVAEWSRSSGVPSLSELFGRDVATSVRSGVDGSFNLDLPPFPWLLQARSDELGVSQQQHVDSRLEEPDDVVLVLGVGEPMVFSVHDAGGNPVAGAAMSGDGIDASSGPDGRITIPRPIRPTRVKLTKTGYTTWSSNLRPRWPQSEWDVLLERAGELEGRVLDAATGDPLTRFRVFPLREAEDGRLRWLVSSFEDFTSLDGSYRLGSLPEGRWAVRVEADAYLHGVSEVIPVTAGQVALMEDMELSPGLKLQGRVLDAKSGEAVMGARIRGGFDDRRFETVVTDTEGRFTVEGLPAGEVTLEATHPRYPRRAAHEVAADPARADEVVVELRLGGAVEGRVLRASGAALASGEVVARWADGSRLHGRYDQPKAEVRDGHFSFPVLPDGDLRIQCFRGCTAGAPVNVVAGEVILVVLEVEGSTRVEGRLYLDGELYRSSQVLVGDWAGESTAATSNGRFAFASVPPGSWTVTVPVAGQDGAWSRASTPLVVPPGLDELQVELRFESGEASETITVEGEVRHAQSGERLAVELVRCVGKDWPVAEGRFKLNLPNGTHEVRASKEGYRIAPVQVLVSEGELASGPVVLLATPENTVDVIVTGVDGRPIAGALCLIHSGGPWETIWQGWQGYRQHMDAHTDVTGRCTAKSLGDGERDLLVFSKAGLVLRPGVDASSQEGPIHVTFGQSGSLLVEGATELRLREDFTGHGWSWPITSHVPVPWFPTLDPGNRTVRLKGMPPGSYTVVVEDVEHRVTIEPGREVVLTLE